jgi:uncharacterized protein with ACT and thioredoxin-like domain
MGGEMTGIIHAVQTEEVPVVYLKMEKMCIDSIDVFDINHVQGREY